MTTESSEALDEELLSIADALVVRDGRETAARSLRELADVIEGPEADDDAQGDAKTGPVMCKPWRDSVAGQVVREELDAALAAERDGVTTLAWVRQEIIVPGGSPQ